MSYEILIIGAATLLAPATAELVKHLLDHIRRPPDDDEDRQE